jgi:hypothetical protein
LPQRALHPVLDEVQQAGAGPDQAAQRAQADQRPTGEELPARPRDTAPTPLQLELAKGHRWLAMLTSGEVKSLREIAAREGADSSFVGRMVSQTTLAPDIVAAILDDALPNHITLFGLAVDPPGLWEE